MAGSPDLREPELRKDFFNREQVGLIRVNLARTSRTTRAAKSEAFEF
jgi:hypothetical protein